MTLLNVVNVNQELLLMPLLEVLQYVIVQENLSLMGLINMVQVSVLLRLLITVYFTLLLILVNATNVYMELFQIIELLKLPCVPVNLLIFCPLIKMEIVFVYRNI